MIVTCCSNQRGTCPSTHWNGCSTDGRGKAGQVSDSGDAERGVQGMAPRCHSPPVKSPTSSPPHITVTCPSCVTATSTSPSPGAAAAPQQKPLQSGPAEPQNVIHTERDPSAPAHAGAWEGSASTELLLKGAM